MIKINNRNMITIEDMLANDWHCGESMYQRGYVSRKITDNERIPITQPMFNQREFRFYYLSPAYNTSYYCYRNYVYPYHADNIHDNNVDRYKDYIALINKLCNNIADIRANMNYLMNNND